MSKRCSVVFDDKTKDLKVKFGGEWRRKDIDIAYRGMLRHLPAHLYELRQELLKPKKPKRSEE